jgi:hypothetical protein
MTEVMTHDLIRLVCFALLWAFIWYFGSKQRKKL